MGSNPHSVAIGDLNGDGKLDLAVANSFSNNVSIRLGDGTGSFPTLTNLTAGTNPRSVAIGDLNGDGKPDLAVANSNSNNVSIRLGTGTGSFGAATNFAAGSPSFVAIGDLNGDGKPDLAVANFGSGSNTGNFLILLGTGAGGFGAATNFAVGENPSSVAIGDLNGDGKPDLAVANRSNNNVSILLNTTAFDPSGSFGTATSFAVGTTPNSVAMDDLNGDGKPDLAVANGSSNTVSILLNIAPAADATAPTVTCPAGSTTSANANCRAAVPAVVATATDDSPGAVTLTQSPAAGPLVGLGTHTITVTATDAAGNSSQCQTTFTVQDTTAPAVVCAAASTASADANCQAAIPSVGSGTDNCAGVNVTQSPAAGTLVGPRTPSR